MGSSFDIIARQAAAAARNTASGASAAVRSETSITARAAELTGRVLDAARQKTAGAGKRRRDRAGVYILTEAESARQETGAEPFTAPDGYVRRTPVQGIATIPHYRARIVRKIVTGVLLAALAAAVVWVLVRYNVIRF